MAGFDPELLRAIGDARVVTVETTRGAGRPTHNTIIWVVVDEAGRVLVRSVRGSRGRWYRELVANPVGALRLGQARIPVHAEEASDSERVAACTRALEAKYRSAGASLASMLREEVLEATLELTPAAGS